MSFSTCPKCSLNIMTQLRCDATCVDDQYQ